MTEVDQRSFRIALVADRYVNPPPGGFDGLAVFLRAGWGLVQLPAELYPADVSAPLLVEVAEQAEEFHRHGYDVVLVGSHEGLREALEVVGMSLPDQVSPADADELLAFLEARPAPAAASSDGS
jgi:hypothetical protein